MHESAQPQATPHRMTGWLSDSDLSIQRPAAIEAARLRRQHRRIKRPRYQQPSDDYHDKASSSGSEGYTEEVEEKDTVERKKFSNELIDMNSNKGDNHRVCDYGDGDDPEEQIVAKVAAVSNLRRQGRANSSSTMEPGDNRINNYSWRRQKETAFTETEPVTILPQTNVQLSTPREANTTVKKMENYSRYQDNPLPLRVVPPQPNQVVQQSPPPAPPPTPPPPPPPPPPQNISLNQMNTTQIVTSAPSVPGTQTNSLKRKLSDDDYDQP